MLDQDRPIAARAQAGEGDETPMTQTVISEVDGNAGRLRLNRPKAIHALDLDMVLKMTASLIEWLHVPEVEAVIIDHAPAPDGDPKLSRGFCAGGDVVTIARSAKGTGAARNART